MAATNEETPGLAAEGFEYTTHPTEEKTMNTQSIPTPEAAATMVAEWKAQLARASAAWRQEHPEILAARPGWAETVTVEVLDGEGPVDLWFEREFGAVRLAKHAVWSAGELAWDEGSNLPEVSIDPSHVEDLTVTQMRELASALMAAIPIVEAASA